MPLYPNQNPSKIINGSKKSLSQLKQNKNKREVIIELIRALNKKNIKCIWLSNYSNLTLLKATKKLDKKRRRCRSAVLWFQV